MLNSFSCFVNFSVVLSMVAARVIYMPLGVSYVTLNKKGIFYEYLICKLYVHMKCHVGVW